MSGPTASRIVATKSMSCRGLFGVAADLDLHGAKALAHEALRLRHHLVHRAQPQGRGIGGEAIVMAPAQQLVERQLEDARREVPQRDVDARHRLDEEAAIVAAVHHDAEQKLPDRFPVQRVAADQKATDLLDDRAGGGGGEAHHAFAGSHLPAIAFDADQRGAVAAEDDAGELRRMGHRDRRLDLVLDRHGKADRLDLGDPGPHSAFSCPNSSFRRSRRAAIRRRTRPKTVPAMNSAIRITIASE